MGYTGHIKRAKQLVWFLEKNIKELEVCSTIQELDALLFPNEDKEIFSSSICETLEECKVKAIAQRKSDIESAKKEVERTIDVYNKNNPNEQPYSKS